MERKAELLEESGVPRKGLVKQGQSVQRSRSSTRAWIGTLRLPTAPGRSSRCKYSVQELRKAHLELCSPEKSGGEGSFGLVRCLNGAAGTGEGGLTGGRDGGIRGRATVGTGVVMS